MLKTVRTRRSLARAKVAVKRKPVVPTTAERNAVFDAIKTNLKNFVGGVMSDEFFDINLSTKSILKMADDAIAAYEKAKK